MKTLPIAGLAIASFLAPLTSSAELLVYKGVLTQQYFGANNQENRSWKITVIVDHDTGHFSQLTYGTLHGVKRYFTSQLTNSHIVDVTGLRGKPASAITRVPTDCEAQ